MTTDTPPSTFSHTPANADVAWLARRLLDAGVDQMTVQRTLGCRQASACLRSTTPLLDDARRVYWQSTDAWLADHPQGGSGAADGEHAQPSQAPDPSPVAKEARQGPSGSPADAVLARAPDGAPSAGPVPLSECITVLFSQELCGKSFSVGEDGRIEKSTEVRVITAKAVTRHVPDAHALGKLLREVGSIPNAAIILNAVRGTQPDDEFTFVTKALLARALDVPLDEQGKVNKRDRHRLVGLHDVKGKLWLARMKENFGPSCWILLDRDVDEHTPKEFDAQHLPFDAWLDLVDAKLLPGVAKAERVVVPSASAKVTFLKGQGTGKRPAGGNAHVYVKVAGDLARLERFASQTLVRASLMGITWAKPTHDRRTGAVIGSRTTAPIDTSVFNPGRLSFEGKPYLGDGRLTVIDAPVLEFDGEPLNLDAIPELTPEDVKQFNDGSAVKVHVDGEGRVTLHNYESLTPDTEIETEGGERMTARAWQAKGWGHTRIQSPFRASTSWAAFIDTNEAGDVFIHDSGTGTTYFMRPCAADAFEKLPPDPGAPKAITAADLARQDAARDAAWPEPFPGVMSDLVAAILAASPRPNAAVATLCVLLGMAGACSGRYALPSSGMRLNLFGLVLMPTGGGKDRPRDVAAQVARLAGSTVMGKPASGAALEKQLSDHGGVLVEIDEAGHLLATMNGKSAQHYLTDLSAVVLKLYSAGMGVYRRRERAEEPAWAKGRPKEIQHPSVSVAMFTTPEKFAESVQTINAEEGFLGRLLTVIVDTLGPMQFSPPAFMMPASAQAGARAITAAGSPVPLTPAQQEANAVEGETGGSREMAVRFGPGAEAWCRQEVERQNRAEAMGATHPLERQLLVRAYEKTLRIAGVLAVWSRPHSPVLELSHLAWAARLVAASDHALLAFAGNRMHESASLADAARLRDICKRILQGSLKVDRQGELDLVRQGRVPRRVAFRHTRLGVKEFDNAVAYLVQTGELLVTHRNANAPEYFQLLAVD